MHISQGGTGVAEASSLVCKFQLKAATFSDFKPATIST